MTQGKSRGPTAPNFIRRKVTRSIGRSSDVGQMNRFDYNADQKTRGMSAFVGAQRVGSGGGGKKLLIQITFFSMISGFEWV